MKVKTQTDATNWKEATRFYDGAGRTIKTQLKNSNGDVFAGNRIRQYGTGPANHQSISCQRTQVVDRELLTMTSAG